MNRREIISGACGTLTLLLAGCMQHGSEQPQTTVSFSGSVSSWTFDYRKAENSSEVSADPSLSCTSKPESIVFSGTMGGGNRDDKIGIVSSDQSDGTLSLTVSPLPDNEAGEGQVEIYYNYTGAVLFRDGLPQTVEVRESEPGAERSTVLDTSDCCT